jgi:hypothetical protein
VSVLKKRNFSALKPTIPLAFGHLWLSDTSPPCGKLGALSLREAACRFLSVRGSKYPEIHKGVRLSFDPLSFDNTCLTAGLISTNPESITACAIATEEMASILPEDMPYETLDIYLSARQPLPLLWLFHPLMAVPQLSWDFAVPITSGQRRKT